MQRKSSFGHLPKSKVYLDHSHTALLRAKVFRYYLSVFLYLSQHTCAHTAFAPHELIRINIKIIIIANNIIIYLTPLSSIKYTNTYSNICIYDYPIVIDFFCTTSCLFDIYLIKLFVCELILLSLPPYMNTVTHITGGIFI